jgi:ankyrin repeat protein
MQAASTGNIALFELLLSHGVDLTTRADDGSTALHCAVKTGQISMIDCLLKSGALIEGLNGKNRSPLHEAVLTRDRAAARLLLQNGAATSGAVIEDIILSGQADILEDALDLNGQLIFKHEGGFMFKRASEMEQAAILRTLLRSPSCNEDWTHTIRSATFQGRPAIFEALLACKKLDLGTVRRKFAGLLYLAIFRGQAKVLETLLKPLDSEVNATDYSGYTPLRTAAALDRIECVKALLEHPQIMVNGAESSLKSSETKITVLHLAAGKGYVEVVKMLLEHPEIVINPRDTHGETPFQRVFRLWRRAITRRIIGTLPDVLRLLLSYHQVHFEFPSHGRPPLLVAIENGDVNMVRLLTEHPRTRQLRENYTRVTLLQTAALHLQWHVVDYLLHGHDVIEPKQDISSEKRLAWQRATLAVLLMDEDFSVNGTDWMGQTLLHKVVQYSHQDLLEELLGCSQLDLNVSDKYGRSALYFAITQGDAARGNEGPVTKPLDKVKLLLSDERIAARASTSPQRAFSLNKPLQEARRWGNVELINLLLQHGAKDHASFY